ncbi:hypothetical protein ACS0TY_018331 [Phlomoides rotata]
MDVDNIAEVELKEEKLLTVLYGIMNTFTTFLNMICALFVLSESELPTDVSRIPRHFQDYATYLKPLVVYSQLVIAPSLSKSGCTVSKHFHRVLNFVIRLHSILLSQPRPIDENCTSERWKHFKGCLGALDGTYINVTVPVQDRAHYRNRKGDILVNVLAVCDIHMNYLVQPIQEYYKMQSLGTMGFVYLKILIWPIMTGLTWEELIISSRVELVKVMENMSYNQTSNAAEKSGTLKRCIWRSYEEATLIFCMKEIIERGCKVDNGFRTGYEKVALKALKQKIPTTDLTVDHIKNKIHVWKKFHTSLQGMLGTSGFECDEARNVMTFRDDDIWDEYVKANPHAKSMKNKSFLCYKD